MQNYILVIIATVLLAVDFALQKLYQQKCGTGARAGLTFNAVVGFATAIVFLFINGFKIQLSLYAIIMAMCMSVCLLSYTILGFKVLKAGNMAFYTMFLMTGGMVVPYVFGLLFLDEPFSLLRIIGLVIIIAAIILSNFNVAKSSSKMIAICVVIFSLNGGCSVSSKLCQTPNPYGVVTPTEFVFMTGAIRFILCSIALLATKRVEAEEENGEKLEFRNVLPIILCSAVVSGVSYMLQLIGAANLPATVLYPIVSGGSIIFSTIAGMICFKERPNLYQKIGVVLCFVGTCLFL